MAPFSEDQRSTIREIAFEVGEVLARRLEERIDMRIALHHATCPTGRHVRDARALSRGVLLAVGGVASFLGWLVPQVVQWIKH